MRVRVKICCISSVEEALLAVRYGADAIGLVSAMPSGPGVIDENLISEIVKSVPPAIGTFLLTSKTKPADIIAQQKLCKTNTIQLVDYPESGTHNILRDAQPGIKIVQVVHVTGTESIALAVEFSLTADAILLDSGNTSLPVKELGGTGRKHDWSVSKKIREAINKPLFLAGGLNALNARQAIESVSPYGLDICSGVRTEGRLDEKKLAEFMRVI